MSSDPLINPTIDDGRLNRDQAGSDHLLEPALPLFPARILAFGHQITHIELRAVITGPCAGVMMRVGPCALPERRTLIDAVCWTQLL